MNKLPTILTRIIDHKRQEIKQRKKIKPLASLRNKITKLASPSSFVQAIQNRIAAGKLAIIAEIKKASPSKGVIRQNFNPIDIAQNYIQADATCLSVLTDEYFFQGHDSYIKQIKQICNLPILRKDFIVDPYQIYESKVIMADCILLIAAALTDHQLKEFTDLAYQLQIDVLVEIHNKEELKRVLKLNTQLIGINNRNLHTFETDINTTLMLKDDIPNNKIIITESGINTIEDVKLMRENNIYAFLIGEALMKETNPGQKLKELFNNSINLER